MIIRPAATKDFDALHRLYKELVGSIDVPDGVEGRAALAAILDHSGTQIFVADNDGPVAAVTLHILPNLTFGGRPYALIENVVTLKSYQGKGIGARIMKHALDAAWEAGCYKVMLLTGTALGARGFYEKLGFEAESKHGMIIRRAPQRQPLGAQG